MEPKLEPHTYLADRADRYAQMARILIEMATEDGKIDRELMDLAMSYLDMAVGEATGVKGNGKAS